VKFFFQKVVCPNGSPSQCRLLYRSLHLPGNVSVEGGHGRVEPLVALDETVLVDLPDGAVLVPGLQVGLQVARVGRHARRHRRLDLAEFLVLLWRSKGRGEYRCFSFLWERPL